MTMLAVNQHNGEPNGTLITVAKDSIGRSDTLLMDTGNLLDHRILAHMGIWAYLNGGRPYLERFFSSPDYDGTREAAFIPSIGRQFARLLPQDFSLVELGPGKALEKTDAFLDAAKKARQGLEPLEYIAVDVVEEYAQEAARHVKEKYHLRTRAIVADYTKMQDIKTNGPAVLVSWNSPIWNSPITTDVEPDFVYASNLKKVGQLVGSDGLVILTHFPLGDTEQAARIYRNEDCKSAVMAIPSLIEKRLTPKCSANFNGAAEIANFHDLFEYSVNVDAANEFIAMDLRAKRDARISIGEYSTLIQEGEIFNAVRSAKPSIGHFHRIAGVSNANIVNTVQDSEGSVVAQALQFPHFNKS